MTSVADENAVPHNLRFRLYRRAWEWKVAQQKSRKTSQRFVTIVMLRKQMEQLIWDGIGDWYSRSG